MKKFKFISLALIFWIIFSLFTSPIKQKKTIFIPPGASRMQIATELNSRGIISSKLIFYGFSIIGSSLKAGEYEFSEGANLLQVLAKIQRGEVIIHKITIPEGLTTSEIIQIIQSQNDLSGIITPKYKEGELLPNTYYYNRGANREKVLDHIKLQMDEILKKLWQHRDKAILLKSPKEALTLASIVEKETEHADEKAKIASVFYNRLKLGMRLQADPTTIYAITKGKFKLLRPLSKKDLSLQSAYNTYYKIGLPPGPICNPGYDTLYAVLHPEKTDYLYFVLNKTGKHDFTKNYSAHLKSVTNLRNHEKIKNK